jgi:hypothetical protein
MCNWKFIGLKPKNQRFFPQISNPMIKNQWMITYQDDVVPSTIDIKIQQSFQQLMVIIKWVVIFIFALNFFVFL